MNTRIDKNAALTVIESINAVDGFDPAPFAVDFADLNTGETRKRLPVMIQMAWFRLRYPEGKIAVEVTPGNDCFVATARVYPSYKDGPECYLAEATASRSYSQDRPSVSPREWAQTAAIGIALRNAGFGLQFAMAGDEFEGTTPNELDPQPQNSSSAPAPEERPEEPAPVELSPEEKLEQAMKIACPIAKYKGKTLGEMIVIDPKSLVWIAEKYKGSEETSAAARLICDYSLEATA